jgi:hypothetical protein
MDRFFGFDLGDAESAIARLTKDEQKTPEMLTVVGEQSFITAYAQLASGELIIGEKACYADNAVKRKLRFKSRFLTDRSSDADVRSFAAGVLGELYVERGGAPSVLIVLGYVSVSYRKIIGINGSLTIVIRIFARGEKTANSEEHRENEKKT